MAASLTPQQSQVARMLYTLGRSHGLGHQRALEFVAAAYSESGLNPHARNPTSGAAGEYQLLSRGYRQKAMALGGLDNPRANALAILPSYLSYWKSHPGAQAGQGGAAVEASGEGAGFYSKGLGLVSQAIGRGGPMAAPSAPAAPAAPQMAAAPVDTTALRHDALQQLIGQIGQKTPDYTGFLGGLQAVKTAEAQAPRQAAPASADLSVHVQPGAKVSKTAVGAVALAKEYLGTPYKWGGSSPATGFDCSGLLQYAYAKQGVKIPRTTYEQFKAGTPVARGQLRAGDAVFFEASNAGPGHVGIFLGNGTFLESPHTGANVRISKLAGRSDYVGARRFA